MTQYVDTRTDRPIGDVPSTVEGSTGAGEPGGPTPTEIANAIGAKADAEQAANVAGLARAAERQDADTKRRQV